MPSRVSLAVAGSAISTTAVAVMLLNYHHIDKPIAWQ